MAKKIKTYDIKVPVFTTEIFEKPNDIFGGITIEHMKDFIKNKIKEYNEKQSLLSFENRNKTKKTIVSEIKVHTDDSNSDAILLQISAYNTNHYDGYLEGKEKIPFEKFHKIGSDTNFIMINPVLNGIDSKTYTHHFLALVYEDPTKSDNEILKLTRQVLNKILNIPIANIKLPTILEELRKIGTIPELQVKYSAIHYHDNNVDVNYSEYLVDGTLSKNKIHKFKDMPMEKIEEIINQPTEEDYQKKETKLTIGKKEYKITKEMINEASDELKSTVEKIYNARTTITEEELNSNICHQIPFIYSKINPILTNYLSNGNFE